MSDVCKGYDGIDHYAYKHYVINYLIMYQRYEDGLFIHANTIEGNWKSIKETCPAGYQKEN
ncbi:hypothetical protein COBT_003088 [Conglomerata obtusa]